MAWRDQLRDASFRGVPFHVMSADGEFGRRTQLHEYPLRDKPFAEDLGRAARRINVEAIIIGPDYMTVRDALIAAAEQPGAGKLIHPYYGELQVVLTDSLRLSETTEHGGMCRVTMGFTESGEATYPSATTDTPTQVAKQADAATDALTEAFEDGFSIDGLPAFVSDSALSTLTAALSQIQAAAALAQGDALGRALFDSLIAGVAGNALSLLAAPASLASQLVAIVSAVRELAPSGSEARRVLAPLGDFGATVPIVPLTTTTRRQQAANQAHLVELVQATALVEASRAIAASSFDSYDVAIAARDEVIDRIDTLLETTASDPLFDALQAVRAAVVRDVQARGGDLARRVTYTPPATMPALVLAYSLYEDVTREADIIARNRIRRPGFVPGGQAIEVLTDG